MENKIIKELIQEVLKKCYILNKNTKHSVFVNFYGHVDLLEIEIYLNGWETNKNIDIKLEVYLDKENQKQIIEGLKSILKKLEALEHEDTNLLEKEKNVENKINNKDLEDEDIEIKEIEKTKMIQYVSEIGDGIFQNIETSLIMLNIISEITKEMGFEKAVIITKIYEVLRKSYELLTLDYLVDIDTNKALEELEKIENNIDKLIYKSM